MTSCMVIQLVSDFCCFFMIFFLFLRNIFIYFDWAYNKPPKTCIMKKIFVLFTFFDLARKNNINLLNEENSSEITITIPTACKYLHLILSLEFGFPSLISFQYNVYMTAYFRKMDH